MTSKLHHIYANLKIKKTTYKMCSLYTWIFPPPGTVKLGSGCCGYGKSATGKTATGYDCAYIPQVSISLLRCSVIFYRQLWTTMYPLLLLETTKFTPNFWAVRYKIVHKCTSRKVVFRSLFWTPRGSWIVSMGSMEVIKVKYYYTINKVFMGWIWMV